MAETYSQIVIPYKKHKNKFLWDFMSKFCEQINNINLSEDIDNYESNFNNVCYFVINKNKIYMMLAFSQQNKDKLLDDDFNNNVTDTLKDNSNFVGEDLKYFYEPFFYTWVDLEDCSIDYKQNCYEDVFVFSLDIKKYNSTLSFSRSYQDRDDIDIYFSKNLLYFKNI